MKSYFWITITVFVLAALFTGCEPRTKKESDAQPLTLSMEGGSPGTVVRITSGQPAFSDAASARVEIGGQLAPIIKRVSATEADVLVPNVAAGESQIKVTGGKASGTAPFTVLAANAQELVLQLTDGKFELVAVHPTADEPNAVARSQEPQLSYDLVSARGDLIFTGSIKHPAQAQMELFDGPNAQSPILRREPPHPGRPVVFVLKVPLVPSGATVKFYDVAPQVNLLDATARQNRRSVGEIKLEK